ncbi:uncharacterized protein DSM5745_08560 [Aspergillus mulundensis]|uniref:Uncharacterized protein n=1 Tax=Aspergillus mulundensis TaxID=1810919 RepID=A0A3D8R4A7_9EURO|nr:hypothetical protein DSM5745_08560 [Aspergillus mulundensis]RDW68800.1 hypothetical protein DSM5745_08560 [Aspergillus mulundensis]
MTTRIDFDNLPIGTDVTTQYHSRGVMVHKGRIASDPSASTPTPNKVLHATEYRGSAEFPEAVIGFNFIRHDHQYIAMTAVSNRAEGAGGMLKAFDSTGRVLIERDFGVPPGSRSAFGEFYSPTATIASFEIAGLADRFVDIDSLVFDDPTEPLTPDFQLVSTNPRALGVHHSKTTEVRINVVRIHGSRGAIRVFASEVPDGVVVSSIVPHYVTDGGDLSFFTLRLTATRDADAGLARPLVIAAEPGIRTAGTVPHTISLEVVIQDAYDVQIVGMEVTQCIQARTLPKKPTPQSTAPVPYQGGESPQVFLAAGKLTVVRVFATWRQLPRSGSPPTTYECRLWGRRNGEDLPGGPLSSLRPLRIGIERGTDGVTDALRSDPRAGAIFTLPVAWTADGAIELTAQLININLWPTPDAIDLEPRNDSFTLAGVVFRAMRPVEVVHVKMAIEACDSGYVNQISESIQGCRTLFPVADNHFTARDVGTMHIDDIYAMTKESCGIFGWATCSVGPMERGDIACDLLRDFVDDNSASIDLDNDPLILGTHAAGGAINGNTSRSFLCLTVSVAEDRDRPLTSVAHELGHAVDRSHAGKACSAPDAVSWPPDDRGLIQGVGLDCRTLRLLFPDDRNEFFDFMSYCGREGSGDPEHWISRRGWRETLQHNLHFEWPPRDPRAPPRYLVGDSSRTSAPGIIVQARVRKEGHVILTKVAPVVGRAPIQAEAKEESAYEIIVQDRALNELHRVHPVPIDDAACAGDARSSLQAVVLVKDYSEIGAVEIHKDSTPVARRVRAVHPPIVKDVKAHLDSADNPQQWTVTWTATSQAESENPLSVKIDYSSNGGSSWTPRYYHPRRNEGVAKLPNLYFSKATGKSGMVRVRVSDGFNLVSAVSAGFDAPGYSPIVRIITPAASGQAFLPGAFVYLHGEAYDDRQEYLTGKSLIWSLDDKEIGHGNVAGTKIAQAGSYSIQLKAIDSHQRVSIAMIKVVAKSEGWDDGKV